MVEAFYLQALAPPLAEKLDLQLLALTLRRLHDPTKQLLTQVSSEH